MKNAGKGIRLPGNLTIIRKYNGQIKITVPKAMAESIDLRDGDVIRWLPTGKGLLISKDKRTVSEFVLNAEKRKQLEEEVAE